MNVTCCFVKLDCLRRALSVFRIDINRYSRYNSAIGYKYVETENKILVSTNVTTTTVNIMYVFFKPKQNTTDK